MQVQRDELPRALYRARDVQELDRRAIERHALTGSVLMTRAGEAAYRLLCARWPRARRVVVLCGPGNNGGDGYVIARLAHEAGREVGVLTVAEPSARAGDAVAMKRACAESGVTIRPFTADALTGADLIVDAMLGTGIEGDVGGVYRDAIEAANRRQRPVLALDIPSGLHADTGRVLGAAVRAQATISFIGLKAGLFTGAGRTHCGEIVFDHLNVPPAIYEGVEPVARRLHPADLQLPPRRAAAAHKGDFGRVLVIGGNRGMPGACALAAMAAYRAGAGLVTVATQPAHVGAITAGCPESLVYGVVHTADLVPLIARAQVIAIGPGLGRDEWASTMFTAALDGKRPLVVDADGLNLLADDPVRRHDWILTPHPGEAARLLGISTDQVQSDRFAAINSLTAKYGGTIALKGSGTLVQHDDGQCALCDRGGPEMASAGMGDVLTGIIAALRAQGMNAHAAALAGVWIHAVAGEQAASGRSSVLASDLMAPIADCIFGLLNDGSA